MENFYPRLAEQVVRTNLRLEKGDSVVISTGRPALPFAEEIAVSYWRVGAQPMISYGSDQMGLRMFREAKPEFLRIRTRLSRAVAEAKDAHVILDDGSPFVEKLLPQAKLQIRAKAMRPIRDLQDRRMRRRNLKVVLVGFPTKELAKAIGIPYARLMKTYLASMSVDVNEVYRYNRFYEKALTGADEVRITGPRTDLTFSVRGRAIHNGSGVITRETFWYLNLPEGEVFTAPVETSAEGEIYFDLPCMWHYGKQVQGVWFRFHKGRVVEYDIEKGRDDFRDVMENATGTKWNIAELGIGTNPAARITGGMTIIDEKVRGTIHLAIGDNRLYGGRGVSTVHWDFFKTMKNGAMEVDGKTVMRNGNPVRRA
jgi:aminopeptidase